MPTTSNLRAFTVVLGAYAVGAAWYWVDPALLNVEDLSGEPGRPLIAFVLPTMAAVLLWLFHAIEVKRPICARESGDRAATERVLFRVLLFLGGLHGLVLLLLTQVPWIQTWGLQLTLVLVGALLMSVGNLLPTTRPNALVGIRTQRSLGSRHFWIAIHRVGGYVAVTLGLVVIVAAVALGDLRAGQVAGFAILAAVGFLIVQYRRLVRQFERA